METYLYYTTTNQLSELTKIDPYSKQRRRAGDVKKPSLCLSLWSKLLKIRQYKPQITITFRQSLIQYLLPTRNLNTLAILVKYNTTLPTLIFQIVILQRKK